MPNVRRRTSPLERILAAVTPVDGCWIYTGGLNHDGYGRLKIDGKMQFAHRVVYTAAHGPVPDGKEVCHSCDVRSCVKPSHLFACTHLANIRDASEKGRMRARSAWTHCLRGHEFTPENTTIRSNGTRLCRTCRADWLRRRKEANAA
jgi:hypothetical protein